MDVLFSSRFLLNKQDNSENTLSAMYIDDR